MLLVQRPRARPTTRAIEASITRRVDDQTKLVDDEARKVQVVPDE
jgi:hypothetical protein